MLKVKYLALNNTILKKTLILMNNFFSKIHKFV